ncbi:MAG: ABC transporter permease [Anaerolineae bacterium]
MGKVLLVAYQQFKQTVWQPPFLLSLLVGPPFVALLFGLFNFLFGSAPSRGIQDLFRATIIPASGNNSLQLPLGYVDDAGIILSLPPEIPTGQFLTFPTQAAAQHALASNQITGYYVIPANYISSGHVTYSGSATPALTTQDQLVQEILMFNLAGGETEPRAQRLIDPLLLAPTQLTAVEVLAEFLGMDLTARTMTGLDIVGFFALALMMTGTILLTSLAMEKEGRILEILLTSVSPRQLILGKFAGSLAICLVQISSWLFWIWILTGSQWLPSHSDIYRFGTAGLILLCGFMAYAALMAVVGALIQSYQESQLITLALAMGALLPLFWLPSVLAEPNGFLATALSMIPLSAPAIMTLRLYLTEVPEWQVIASLGLSIGWTGITLWLAVRLFHLQFNDLSRARLVDRLSHMRGGLMRGSALIWMATALYFLLVQASQRQGLAPLFVLAVSGLSTGLLMMMLRPFFAAGRGLAIVASIHILTQLWLQWQWNLWDSPNYLLHNLNALVGLVAMDSLLAVLISVTLLLIRRDISVWALAIAYLGCPLSLLWSMSRYSNLQQINTLFLRDSAVLTTLMCLIIWLAVGGAIAFCLHFLRLVYIEATDRA